METVRLTAGTMVLAMDREIELMPSDLGRKLRNNGTMLLNPRVCAVLFFLQRQTVHVLTMRVMMPIEPGSSGSDRPIRVQANRHGSLEGWATPERRQKQRILRVSPPGALEPSRRQAASEQTAGIAAQYALTRTFQATRIAPRAGAILCIQT